MIPQQELRIGNLVLKEGTDEYYKIEQGRDIDQPPYTSIAITPAVLARCGFAFHDHFHIWQKNKTIANSGPDMELDPDFWVLDFSHRRIGVELKGLHQLQNLYFMLKGKELDVQS